jgi:hypothetical protein
VKHTAGRKKAGGWSIDARRTLLHFYIILSRLPSVGYGLREALGLGLRREALQFALFYSNQINGK